MGTAEHKGKGRLSTTPDFSKWGSVCSRTPGWAAFWARPHTPHAVGAEVRSNLCTSSLEPEYPSSRASLPHSDSSTPGQKGGGEEGDLRTGLREEEMTMTTREEKTNQTNPQEQSGVRELRMLRAIIPGNQEKVKKDNPSKASYSPQNKIHVLPSGLQLTPVALLTSLPTTS